MSFVRSISVIVLVSLVLMLPIWWYGLPINSHDAKVHASWQYYFSAQLWNGEAYPRWLAAMNEGLGSPSFFIYPPLSQYAAALLAPFSASTEWLYQRIGIAATLAFLLSGLGASLWLRKVTGERVSALLGALVFLVSPYHLFIDTYYRAAYAELWAFAWAPFSLLAIHLFRERLTLALVLYTAATSALLFSHAPSCIALLPVYIAYAALLSWIYKEKSILVWTGAATGIAILIAGTYLATALTHQANINTAALFSGGLDYAKWFLFSQEPWSNAKMESGFTGIAVFQFSMISGLGLFLLTRSGFNPRLRLLTVFAMGVSVGVFVLMSSVSAPLWTLVPVLQKIQFPWRLMLTQTVGLALATALFSVFVRARSQSQPGAIGPTIAPLIVIALILINVAMSYSSPPAFNTIASPRTRDAPEYHLGSILMANEHFEAEQNVRLLSGTGLVTVKAISPREIIVQVDAATPLSFTVRHFYYPGWQCMGSALPVGCTVGPYQTGMPLITVHTGIGNGLLTLRLTPSTYDKAGTYASMAGVVLLLLTCVFAGRLQRSAQRSSAVPSHQPRPPETWTDAEDLAVVEYGE